MTTAAEAKEAIIEAIEAYEDIVIKTMALIKTLKMRLIEIDTIENT